MRKMIKKTLAVVLSAATLVSTGMFSGCAVVDKFFGDFTIEKDAFDIDFGYCEHKLTKINKVEASCLKIGKKTAYECEKCGKLFSYGYLNGKNGEKGLYEIEAQELSDFGAHKVGDFFGDLNTDATSFDATSLEDFSVWSHCSETGCGEVFEVERQNLIAFAPADDSNSNARHVTVGEETDATVFAIPSGTSAGKCYTITTADSGKMKNATHKIPFDANVARHVVLFFHNDGAQDVNVRYGTEFYGERCGVDVTVPANGYATGSFDILISQSNGDSYHELYINSDIKSAFNLTISGFYYHETKLQNIKVEQYPQIEYAIGETFNAEDLVVVADYGDNITRRLKPSEYQLVLNNNKAITEPLTAEDDTVFVMHQNKQVKFAIKVQKFEQTVTLVGATFADSTTSKVFDRNAVLPSDILPVGDKVIVSFVDQYGATYVPGTSKVPAYNPVLTPVYEGVTYSANYALGAAVTASHTAHGGQKAMLVDGIHALNSDEDNRWSTGSNYDTATPEEADREWVTVDLGEAKSISKVVLYPRVTGGYFPEAYEILVSENGEDWTKVTTVELDTFSAKNVKVARHHFFNSVNAQYVKVVAVKMTDANDGWGYIFQLSEIEVYGEVDA